MPESATDSSARSDAAPGTVRLHAFEPFSRANGPGLRAVIWFQGCTLGCPGCFNPGTHPHAGGSTVATRRLAARVLAHHEALEGVTFSGGEPFEQPAALVDLARTLRAAGLGTIVFSGFTLAEIARRPYGDDVLATVDAVIAGRYLERLHSGRGLIGSRNQRVVLLTDRYRAEDFERVPPREAVLHADGSVTWSGIGARGIGMGTAPR